MIVVHAQVLASILKSYGFLNWMTIHVHVATNRSITAKSLIVVLNTGGAMGLVHNASRTCVFVLVGTVGHEYRWYYGALADCDPYWRICNYSGVNTCG